MSSYTAVGDDLGVCANCGRRSGDEGGFIKLKNCTACRLVKYCGVECQKAHRKQHKKACKQRAAELKGAMMICGACERELPEGSFSVEQRGRRQSSRICTECVVGGNQLALMKKGRARSEEDECPICQLLSPLDSDQSSFSVCCMKLVCNGCILAALKREMRDCPFCRTPTPDESAVVAMVQKRVNAGDPVAIHHLGRAYHWGHWGLEKDMTRAIESWKRAAELGLKEAHYDLGCLHSNGTGGEKDKANALRHWEAAAIRGEFNARFILGCEELVAGSYDLALQHFMISANMGHDSSLKKIKQMIMHGIATKADYAEALRGHQSAVEEMQSPDRDEAATLGLEKLRLL